MATLLRVAAMLLVLVQPLAALDSVSRNLLQLAGSFQEDPTEASAAGLDWESLPAGVNLRGEVEDLGVNFIQQGLRNSCAAFSATSMLELQLRRLGMNIDLSEQYVLWATTRFGADPSIGLTTSQLSRALVTHKICSEESMPYRRGDKILEPAAEALAEAAAMPEIRRIDVLPQGPRMGLLPEDIFAICRRLAQYQPLCLSAAWAEDGGTLDRNFVLQDTNTAFFHMVLVIGYELPPDNPMDGYFLIRNSWGLRWGDFGYAKIPFSYVRKHAVDAIAFEFHWNGEPAAEPEETGDSMQLASLFPAFLSVHGGIVLLAFACGLAVSVRCFGAGDAGFPGILRYAVLCLLLYFGLERLSGMALDHGIKGWEKDFLLPMAGFLGVIVVLVRMTIRSFELSAVRAVGFLIVMLAVWNAVFLGGSRVVPINWYAEWRDATPDAVAADYLALGSATAAERADFLRISGMQPAEVAPAEVDPDGERLRLWESALRGERSRMREDHPVAADYYARRMKAYRTQLAAYHQRHPGGLSAAAPVDRQSVWRLYEELQTERATLDRSDAAAVQAFNQKVEQYQQMKSRMEAAAPDPPAAEAGL